MSSYEEIIQVRVTSELARTIDKAADRKGISRSGVVRMALARWAETFEDAEKAERALWRRRPKPLEDLSRLNEPVRDAGGHVRIIQEES